LPSKKRIWYPGATYHITSRGNRKSKLFKEKEDYKVYLRIIRSSKDKYNFNIYSYCLMTNHVHLQLKTEEIEIWKIMRRINWHYAKYFNNKYNLVGHLFQGRYRASIIEKDYYQLVTSRYIHLNPLKAELVKDLEEYEWSSYSYYLGIKPSDIVNESKILSYFKDGLKGNKRKLYKKYVESGIRKI